MTDFLVTGASGHLGQLVLGHLLDTLGVAPSRVVATSRNPEKLDAWKGRGVTVRAADFEKVDALPAAFAGARRLLLISTDALDGVGTRLRQHSAAVAAPGVDHLVYTSLPFAERSPVSFAPDHAGTERAIAESALPGWTVLRNHWYCENLLHSLPNAFATGKWYSAAGEGRLAYIPRGDLALAAAKALSDDFTGKRTLTLGGTRSYTTKEIAALAAKATGKPLEVVDVPAEGLVQGMISAGLPEPVARTFASFDAAAKEGCLDGGPEDFVALTGRQPGSVEDWIAANAEKLIPH